MALSEKEELELLELEAELNQTTPSVWDDVFSETASSLEELPALPAASEPGIQDDLSVMTSEGGTIAPPASMSRLSAAQKQIGQGLTLGFAPEISAGIEKTLARLFGNKDVEELYKSKTFSDLANQYRAEVGAADAQFPIQGAALRAVGSLPVAIAAQAAAPAAFAPTVAGQAKLGASLGAVSGFGESRGDDVSERLGDAAISGALGGILGGGLTALTKTGSALTSAGQSADELANQFAVASAGNKNKVIEQLGPEGVQRLGKMLREEDIVTPLASRKSIFEKTLQKAQDVGRQIGSQADEIDSFLSDLDVINPAAAKKIVLRPKALESELRVRLSDQLDPSKFQADLADYLDEFISKQLARYPQSKQLGVNELRDIRINLDRQIKNWSSQGNLDRASQLRDLRGAVEDVIEAQIKKAGDAGGEDLLTPYLEAKTTYRGLQEALQLSEDQLIKNQKNRLFSLTDYVAGTAGTAAGADGVEALGQGLATAAFNKGLRQYGNQLATGAFGGAGRALQSGGRALQRVTPSLTQQVSRLPTEKLLQTLGTNPESLGRFAPILSKALQRGSDAFAATHYVLSGTDEDYRTLLEQQNKE